MRTRRQLTKCHTILAHKELDAPNARSRQRFCDGTRHPLRFGNMRIKHRNRLPALLVVAALLPVTDRWTEQRRAVLLRHRKQCDLKVKVHKCLDNHFHEVATGAAARIVPGILNFGCIPDHRLPLAAT